MSDLRTIEIDLDIHKLIEAQRLSFSEPPNSVLRRLLKLAGSAPSALATDSSAGAWTGKGVTLPSGTQLRMQYRGKEHRGEIQDSCWIVDGHRFKSPSAAAGGVATTKDGRRPSLDGWKYWHIKRSGDPGWTSLDLLRQRAARA
jgi:hypothetical protein